MDDLLRNVPPPPPLPVTTPHKEANKPATTVRDKFKFSLEELSDLYGITRKTVIRMIGDAPMSSAAKRKGIVYDMRDISTLNDMRIGKKLLDPAPDLLLDDNGEPLNIGSPAQMRLYYQAKDIEQAYLLKKQKLDAMNHLTLPAHDVEKGLAQAFKGLATFIDNLPDILERAGIIDSTDISRVIDMTDKIRIQLAEDMSKIGGKDVEDDGK